MQEGTESDNPTPKHTLPWRTNTKTLLKVPSATTIRQEPQIQEDFTPSYAPDVWQFQRSKIMREGDLQLLSIPSRFTAISFLSLFFFQSRRSAGVGGNLTPSLVKFPRSHDGMNFRWLVEWFVEWQCGVVCRGIVGCGVELSGCGVVLREIVG